MLTGSARSPVRTNTPELHSGRAHLHVALEHEVAERLIVHEQVAARVVHVDRTLFDLRRHRLAVVVLPAAQVVAVEQQHPAVGLLVGSELIVGRTRVADQHARPPASTISAQRRQGAKIARERQNSNSSVVSLSNNLGSSLRPLPLCVFAQSEACGRSNSFGASCRRRWPPRRTCTSRSRPALWLLRCRSRGRSLR